MKLKQVTIENYRAIEHLELPLHPQLTVLHGDNGHGKTSVLSAIAVGLARLAQPSFRRVRWERIFSETDQRQSGPLRVAVMTTDNLSWEQGTSLERPDTPVLRDMIDEIRAADEEGLQPLDLPIWVLYDTERSLVREPWRLTGRQSSRFDALLGAISAGSNFRRFFEWFYDRENVEIRIQRELRDFDYRLHDLDAIRRAVGEMVPGISQPSIEHRLEQEDEKMSFRFTVSMADEHGNTQTFDINQLSGGYRIMLALVADLARRMAQGNPHLDNPLLSEAVVLIDEVDLHLHPSWQQRVLPDLMRTFPNAQFIVSTHSPQVLTTVKPEHIVELYREGDGVVAGGVPGPTYGAEAGDVLDAVMRVDERPPNNEFVSTLEAYVRLVDDGLGQSDDAKLLRAELEKLSPHDPALDRADMEIWRHQFLRNIEEPQ